MEHEEPHNTIDLKQAIDNLSLMFPNIEKETMIVLLKENNGQLEATIEQLLIVNEPTSAINENESDLLDFNNTKYDTKLENDDNVDNLNENINILPVKNEDILEILSSSPTTDKTVDNETYAYELQQSLYEEQEKKDREFALSIQGEIQMHDLLEGEQNSAQIAQINNQHNNNNNRIIRSATTEGRSRNVSNINTKQKNNNKNINKIIKQNKTKKANQANDDMLQEPKYINTNKKTTMNKFKAFMQRMKDFFTINKKPKYRKNPYENISLIDNDLHTQENSNQKQNHIYEEEQTFGEQDNYYEKENNKNNNLYN